jgi:hypothetical protein
MGNLKKLNKGKNFHQGYPDVKSIFFCQKMFCQSGETLLRAVQ